MIYNIVDSVQDTSYSVYLQRKLLFHTQMSLYSCQQLFY